jgi:hypothetical protein
MFGVRLLVVTVVFLRLTKDLGKSRDVHVYCSLLYSRFRFPSLR